MVIDWDNRCERLSESVRLCAVAPYAVCVYAVCVCYCLQRILLVAGRPLPGKVGMARPPFAAPSIQYSQWHSTTHSGLTRKYRVKANLFITFLYIHTLGGGTATSWQSRHGSAAIRCTQSCTMCRIAARREGSGGRPLVTSPACLDWANSVEG